MAADNITFCTGVDDTCGNKAGETTMCCGAAINGKATDGDGKATDTNVPNMAVCNKAPVDGKAAATDMMGTLTGADTAKTAITYMFDKADFSCFVDPLPPQPPAPVKPADDKVGVSCKAASDTCGNADGKTDYCCGVFTGGKLIGADKKPITSSSAFNSVACNINPDGDKKPAQDW